MKTRIALASLALLAFSACEPADPPTATAPTVERSEARASDRAATRTFEVTIQNLTTSGQPLTPPVVALHSRAEDLFTVGEPASTAVSQIAENGNLAPMLALLEGSRHVSVHGVGVTSPVPPLEPGESVTLSLETGPGSQFVSFVAMLVCTNDGFTGLDAAKLPNRVGQETSWYTDGYDAGTEINTEDFADIVPPCQPLSGVFSDDAGTGASNPALAENGVIRLHPGIQGGDDLVPAVHGWDDPVAKITVRRTS